MYRFRIDLSKSYFVTDIEWGRRLLDIGTGPTIHSIISSSRRLEHIDISDFSPNVLQILRDWHTGKRQIESEILKYEMSLEGDKYVIEK